MTRYLYIFDFDDTLYPTTHMKHPTKFNNPINLDELSQLDYVVTKLLSILLDKEFTTTPPIHSEWKKNTEYNTCLFEPFPITPSAFSELVPSSKIEEKFSDPDNFSDTSGDDEVEKYTCVKSEDLIRSSPKIILISNSSFQALKYNMWDMPELGSICFENPEFKIISSREEISKKLCELKKLGQKLKVSSKLGLKKLTPESTLLEVSRFYRNVGKISVSINILEGFIESLLTGNEKVKIISFGDDESEQVALKSLQNHFENEPRVSCVNVNFKKELSVNELTLNFETVIKNIEIIKNSDKDVDM
jgi:hypothetical protein